MKTVVGLYNTTAEANKVKSTLQTEGYGAEHITVIDQTGENSGTVGSTGTTATGSGESFGTKIKDFFSGFSDHNDEHERYTKNVGNGGALLAVTVPDDEAEETADLLYQHGATGIQGDYSNSSASTGAEDVAVLESNKSTGYNTGTSGAAVSGEQVIPVVEEDLVVGKREVDRGGVRIYSRVVSEPVSADVNLRNERVVVDRTPVNRAATDADFTNTGVVELTATGEEAVVGKTSRVIEEVRVGKTSSEHTEQVNDTVRHTEVEVEPVTATTTTGSGYGITTDTTKTR